MTHSGKAIRIFILVFRICLSFTKIYAHPLSAKIFGQNPFMQDSSGLCLLIPGSLVGTADHLWSSGGGNNKTFTLRPVGISARRNRTAVFQEINETA